MTAQEKEARFASAVEQHRDALYRVCCAYVREESNRQDIYQEVLISLWNSLDGFRGESSFGTWVYRIAVNTCLGWLRREKRRYHMLERVCEAQATDTPVLGAPEPGASDTAVRYLDERGVLWVLTGYAAFIIALCGFALVVSWKDWRKETAHLLGEIRRCQGELQNG
jgi:RNA polymerase sigma factor (sigma-70 family)